jgi:hypothetical protein
MKIQMFLLLGIVSVAYASEASGRYIKTTWYGNWIAAQKNNSNENCTGNVNRTLLLRIPHANFAETGNTQLWRRDLQGACFSYDTVGKMHLNSTQSAAFTESASTPGKLSVVHFAKADCEGDGTLQYSGFTVSMANSNGEVCGASQTGGLTACGVTLNGNSKMYNHTVPAADGCQAAAAAANDGSTVETFDSAGWNIKATYFKDVRAIAMQIQGPFADATCNLATSSNFDSFPMVIPLTDLVANVAASNEPAISTTGLCYDYGFEGHANSPAPKPTGDVNLWQVATTADKGKIEFIYSDGTNGDYTDRTTCTAGSTTYAKFYWDVGITGNYTYCTRAVSSSGSDISKWYKVQPFWGTLGDIPNAKDYFLTQTTNGTASPASSLNLSALMTITVALFAAMM